MRWGGKQDRDGHLNGPFDMTHGREYLALNDTQRWLAVRLGHAEYDEKEGGAGL
jgi:hypothetical protein